MLRKFTVEDIVKNYNISNSLIQSRARKLGIKPLIINKQKKYLFTEEQVIDIVNYTYYSTSVIYVTQTWLILESKINKQ